MNKLDFLRRLDKELSVLDKEERREILAFYEERFYTGTIYENKTEEEVIADLESPEAIARNVLEEYGVSPKYVKKSEERYSNISVAQVVFLLAFDVIIASWIIPTLFSVAVSIFGSSFSYIGAFGLLVNGRTTVDEFLFAFLTGAYILYFLFGLVVLSAGIFVTKKIIIWHLNVFKIKKRDKYIKRLSRISVDGWFKRHRRLNNLKNIALVGALVTVAYTGFWMFNHYDWVEAEYGAGEVQSDVYTEDFTTEIAAGDAWNIETNFDSMDVDLVLTDGSDVTITHKYYDDDHFTYNFDYDTNTITITNDIDNQFVFDFTKLISLVSQNYEVRIEVPSDLVLGDNVIHSANGEVDIRNVDMNSVEVVTTNGNIILTNIIVNGDVTAHSTNGTIIVKDITELAATSTLDVATTNGTIDVQSVNFHDYVLITTNGTIELSNLNDDLQDGNSLSANSTNGSLTLDEVYVDNITLGTTNGDIDFYNTDTTFLPSSFEKDTTNGNISTNVR